MSFKPLYVIVSIILIGTFMKVMAEEPLKIHSLFIEELNTLQKKELLTPEKFYALLKEFIKSPPPKKKIAALKGNDFIKIMILDKFTPPSTSEYYNYVFHGDTKLITEITSLIKKHNIPMENVNVAYADRGHVQAEVAEMALKKELVGRVKKEEEEKNARAKAEAKEILDKKKEAEKATDKTLSPKQPCPPSSGVK